MTASPSATTWRRAIDRAQAGEPHLLLELLLTPTETDSRGKPLPGAFYALPDDAELRLAIVRALMFGPWKGATTVGELMTRTGWGKTKPRLSEREVSFAAMFLQHSTDPRSLEVLADGYGVEPETLRKRVDEFRRRK